MSEQQATTFKRKKSFALSGVKAGNTALRTRGKTGNELHYRGHHISDVSTACEFEETANLLSHGEPPTATELRSYNAKLKSLRGLQANVSMALETLPASSRPMDVGRAGVLVLGCVLLEKSDHNTPSARVIADRLMAPLGLMLLYWYHFSYNGKGIETEADGDSIGCRFRHLRHGQKSSALLERAMHIVDPVFGTRVQRLDHHQPRHCWHWF